MKKAAPAKVLFFVDFFLVCLYIEYFFKDFWDDTLSGAFLSQMKSGFINIIIVQRVHGPKIKKKL
jgi:hypothetical protein